MQQIVFIVMVGVVRVQMRTNQTEQEDKLPQNNRSLDFPSGATEKLSG